MRRGSRVRRIQAGRRRQIGRVVPVAVVGVALASGVVARRRSAPRVARERRRRRCGGRQRQLLAVHALLCAGVLGQRHVRTARLAERILVDGHLLLLLLLVVLVRPLAVTVGGAARRARRVWRVHAARLRQHRVNVGRAR